MSNEFDKIMPLTLPPIDIVNTDKTVLASQFADAVRRTYDEADLRKQAMDLLSEAIGIAKTLLL
jgi:hypothetical protein